MSTKKRSIGDWVRDTDLALSEMIHLMRPLGSDERLSSQQIQTLVCLSTRCLDSSASTLILLEHERPWDAEAVLRSCFEATVRFVYLLSDQELFNERYNEYFHDLSEISSLRNHAKARNVLDVVSDPMSDQWRPIREILLEETEIDRIKNQYPKRERQKIESRWSFSNIVADLVSTRDSRWGQLSALLHVYRNASHVIHADYQGISMIMEREYQDPERRRLARDAHTVRILSDIICLQLIRIATAYRFLNLNIDSVILSTSRAGGLLDEFRRITDQWSSFEYPAASYPT